MQAGFGLRTSLPTSELVCQVSNATANKAEQLGQGDILNKECGHSGLQ